MRLVLDGTDWTATRFYERFGELRPDDPDDPVCGDILDRDGAVIGRWEFDIELGQPKTWDA